MKVKSAIVHCILTFFHCTLTNLINFWICQYSDVSSPAGNYKRKEQMDCKWTESLDLLLWVTAYLIENTSWLTKTNLLGMLAYQFVTAILIKSHYRISVNFSIVFVLAFCGGFHILWFDCILFFTVRFLFAFAAGINIWRMYQIFANCRALILSGQKINYPGFFFDDFSLKSMNS